MSATEPTYADIEGAGTAPRRQRRRRSSRRRPSVGSSTETTAAVTTDGSLCFSNSDDDQSWHSTLDSAAGGSHDECGSSGIEGVSCSHSHRESCSVSECEVDLESGELEHFGKEERDCRICHLNINLVGGSGDSDGDGDGGDAIELGCDCKGDLGAAHKQCAETWFKIKGDTTCEICGTTALNVAGEQTNEANNAAAAAAPAASTTAGFSEPQTYWQGRRIMNLLFGCMVLAFVISWLLHFKVFP